jgi:hypothetical protein
MGSMRLILAFSKTCMTPQAAARLTTETVSRRLIHEQCRPGGGSCN